MEEISVKEKMKRGDYYMLAGGLFPLCYEEEREEIAGIGVRCVRVTVWG